MSSPTLTKLTINSTDVTSHIVNWKEINPDANINQFVVALDKTVYDTEEMIRDDPYGTEVLIQRGVTLATEQNIVKGIILTRETVGQLVTLKVADYLAITKKRKITRTFSSNVDTEEGVISEIFKTLINDYTDLTADDDSVVNSGEDVIVRRLVANNVSIYKMLQDLAELLNWQFYYNSETDKVHFEPKGTRGSSETLTVGQQIVQRPIWQRDGDKKIRVLTVQGGPTETGTVQNFNGDGSVQEFVLAHTPVTINSIYVDSTLQTGGTEGQTLAADYYVDYANKTIKFDDGSVPGSGSGNIVVDYTYLSPITITGENNIPEGDEVTDRRPNLLTVGDVQTYLENKLERYSEDFVKSRTLVNQISGVERGQTVQIIDTNEAIEDEFIVTDIRREFPYRYDVLEVTTEPLDFDDEFANLEDRVRRIEERLIQEEDLVIILKQGSRFFKIGRRWMKVEKRNIAGENGIYGNPDFGIYGVSKYGDEQSFGFVLGNSKGGILGTSILGSNVSDAVLKFMQQGGDYYFEDFIDDDFEDAETTADWGSGSVSFDGGEIASSKSIDYNHGTITAAKLTATEVSGDFLYFMKTGGEEEIIDSLDSVASWGTVYGLGPTLDTSNKIEGSGCMQGGTSNTSFDYFSYRIENAYNINAQNKVMKVWVYIDDLTELREAATVLFIIGNGVLSGGGPYAATRTKTFQRSDLQDGWNLLTFDVSNEGVDANGTLDETDIRSLRITFNKTNTTDTVADGNIKIDHFRFDAWEEVTSAAAHTFSNSGTDLKWKAVERAGSTGEISQIVVEDYH